MDTPTILNITVNSNKTHPTVIGDPVVFSINWVDSQQPNEQIKLYICSSDNVVNNSGCIDTSYVHRSGISSSSFDATYVTKETDTNNANGMVEYYAVICDSTGYCSDTFNSTQNSTSFSVIHKPNVTGVSVLGTDSLTCDYTFSTPTPTSLAPTEYYSGNAYLGNRSTVKWYYKTKDTSWSYLDTIFGAALPAFLTENGTIWKCEVTPYDGYASGAAENSSNMVVIGYNTTKPLITDASILHADGSDSLVTYANPLTYGDLVKINVHWYDPYSNSVKLYALNDSTMCQQHQPP
jgi:hypothetical protein